MPQELKLDRLTPITQEPLLNYLVALSHEREHIKFTEQTTLNEIYSDLLISVYERQWEGGKVKGRLHVTMEKLEYEEFQYILEEIALTVWHGNGRTTTAEKIFNNLDPKLTKQLEIFQESAEKGISRLLTAFYFRQSNNKLSEYKTFEFTHKNFGEYLIAKRLFRAVRFISETLLSEMNHSDCEFRETKALKYWAEVTGPTPISSYIFDFFHQEVVTHAPNLIANIQSIFVNLIKLVIKTGFPMHELNIDSFRNMIEQSKNAEEMLFVVHHCCCTITKTVLPLNLEQNDNKFGQLINRILEHNTNRMILKCLTYLDLRQQNLKFQRWPNANLQGSNLEFAFLTEANLRGANLRKTNLSHTDLTDTNLVAANLKDTEMASCNLCGANLTGAETDGCNFKNARYDSQSIFPLNIDISNLNYYFQD